MIRKNKSMCHVCITEEPVITSISESTSKVKAQWIYLKCSADGFPKPTITWLKDGNPIDYKQSNYDVSAHFT